MSDPFWETYYPPNGWNCRCTVAQVRKQKYPATPHQEAMDRGAEALDGERYNIFRFNSGKQEKTMPDYNPYTIRRCNDCDVAKGKMQLALPDNEVCQACKFLQSCANNRDLSLVCVEKKSIVKNSSNFVRRSEALRTGKYFQTRKALRLGLRHARTLAEATAFRWLPNKLDELRFIRFSPMGETKDLSQEKDIANVNKKTERGAIGYNIYEIDLGGETWQLKTEVRTHDRETLYNIFKKK